MDFLFVTIIALNPSRSCHASLAPNFLNAFDLSSISSLDIDAADLPVLDDFRWPRELPSITVRLIPVALKYLGQPGKERDGAKVLLAKISMRKDMQELGVMDAVVGWALSCL